jgi:hypothetical protein
MPKISASLVSGWGAVVGVSVFAVVVYVERVVAIVFGSPVVVTDAPVSVVVAAVMVVIGGSVVEEESLMEEELGRHSPALTPAKVLYAKILAMNFKETMLVNGLD